MKECSRVLVVDDNRHNIRLLKSMLSAQAYEVVSASNGREALDSVAETPPDLIVLDVIMPDMDGFTVTRVLRATAETRAIPILLVTALNDIKDKVKGFEAGADDFLTKPFNGVELLARVRSLLRIKQLHDELQEKNAILERVLMRYVSEDVARRILSNPDQNLRLGGQNCEVSVLFADIRGFTQFSEKREASLVTEMLNYIFGNLTPIVFEYQGTLDKYLGDAIMAFYGAPIPSPNSPEQAVRTAWTMQQLFVQLCQENTIADGLGLGIGICTGKAVVGNIGSERIMDYTVIGNTPNIAKRLQEHAKPGQILINAGTYQVIKDVAQVREIEPVHYKGGSAPMQAYEVIAVSESAAVNIQDLENSPPKNGNDYEEPVQLG